MVKLKPTVISLFAGCGGSSLGYKMAGFKELLAIDFDDNAIKTFRLNFKEVPILKRDVTKLTGKELLEYCDGELDVLDGSPPCQGFSTAGKRQVCDIRNNLVGEYIRLVSEVKPKMFVMENVSGMIKGTMKGLFIEYIQQMKKLNYNVSCKVMNAMFYSVPQSRSRLICIGVRNDIGNPSFPLKHDKIITARDAIGHLPKGKASGTKRFIHYWKRTQIGKPFSTAHPKKHMFNTRKLHPNRPAPTIIKNSGSLSRWDIARILTTPELKKLQSFPDDFKFIGSTIQQWGRIGNSVPPLMMKAIAETIKPLLEHEKRN